MNEAKELFAELLGLKMENIIIGGQSSLALMYDNVIKAYVLGVYGGSKPWGQQGKIKYLLIEVIAVTAGADNWSEIAMCCKGKNLD